MKYRLRDDRRDVLTALDIFLYVTIALSIGGVIILTITTAPLAF